MKKIICAHLFNDFSGSPLVLSTVVRSFQSEGHHVEIITSSATEGFLSKLDVTLVNNNYKYLNNRYLRLVMFFYCQVVMFFKTLKYRNDDAIIYVNTLLPFGVALAGKLMGKKVIYHFHETSLKPLILKDFLKWIASITATEIVYVSNFLKEKEGVSNVTAKVIYNSLSDDFVKIAEGFKKEKRSNEDFVILMLCSLKSYKGVNEFVDLSVSLPNYSFNLVLNASENEIDDYFKETRLPQNLNLFPRQSNVHPFFQKADLVVNLSHPEEWIETFGMTLIEGMQYGLPIIAPPIGGPTEIVFPKYNGYLIDQRDKTEILDKITKIASNEKLYEKLSRNSSELVQKFNMKSIGTKYLDLVNLN